jgi:hypothetical protein
MNPTTMGKYTTSMDAQHIIFRIRWALQTSAAIMFGKLLTVPLSGPWIPEEQPQFVIEQLAGFFSE